jgi:hypothetical protein
MDNDLFEVLEFKPTSSLEGDIFYSLWKRCFDLCKTLQRGLTPARNSSNSDLWKKSYEAFLTAGHVIQKIIEKNTSLTTQYVLARATIRARDDEILTFRQELSNADAGPEPRRTSKQNLVVFLLV